MEAEHAATWTECRAGPTQLMRSAQSKIQYLELVSNSKYWTRAESGAYYMTVALFEAAFIRNLVGALP